MVNVNSHLYQAHPDWTIEIPGKPHAEGRNQRILDLTRREVQDYIIETMTKVFSSYLYKERYGKITFYSESGKSVEVAINQMGYEPDVYGLLFRSTSARAAGGGGTPLCAGTVPVHERAYRAFPGHSL
jgi:hypothetical protein